MLLTMMMKKNMWIFLLIGFVLNAYVGIPTLGCAIIAAAIAGFYDFVVEGQKNTQAAPAIASAEGADDGEEYDL